MLLNVSSAANSDSNIQCEDVHNYSYSEQCEFVESISDCHNTNGFINYIQFAYCSFAGNIKIPLIIFGIWISFLFAVLGLTTDELFYGVTLLAFGNGAPDIFASWAATHQDRPELVISGLFGAGIFVTCIVAGSIVILKPFHVTDGPFFRDLIFYLAAVFWAFAAFRDGEVRLFDATGFLVLYVIYIVAVILGPKIYRIWNNRSNGGVLDSSVETIYTPVDGINSTLASDELILESTTPTELHDFSTSSLALLINENMDETTPLLRSPLFQDTTSSPLMVNSAYRPMTGCKKALWPIDATEWSAGKWYFVIYDIVKAPVFFALKLTIPLVDHEKEHNNWCRTLNALHLLTGPMFVTFATKHALLTIGDTFPVWALVLCVGAVFAVTVFFTSSYDEPPSYHTSFAYLGFATSIVWIYTIANEIVNVLKAFGVILNIDDATLGLTVLAWGNSISDLIADTSIARKGSPLMAFSACFGGPLFNLLVGMGVSFTTKTAHSSSHYIAVNYDKTVTILSSFLFISLASFLVAVPIMKFHVKRWFGIYLMLIYLIFIIIAILDAANIL